MSKILMELLAAVVIACIPVITNYAVEVLTNIADKAAANSKSTLVALCIKEIADAVSTAVEATNQTYVDCIKNSSDPFTKEAQQKAFEMAYKMAVASLSKSTKEFIEKNYGSLEDYLTSKIEAEVRSQKNNSILA